MVGVGERKRKMGEAIDWLTFPVSLGSKWISSGWGFQFILFPGKFLQKPEH